jgi:outer membrane protein assembly factor BamB
MQNLLFFSKSSTATRRPFVPAMASLAVAFVMLITSSGYSGDWTSWRGPTQNGVSPEKNLPTSASDFAWRVPLGGHSTDVIYKGRVFGVNLANPTDKLMEQEQLYCVELATGKLIWAYRFNCFHTDVPDSRVGWSSPAIDPETGYIYVNGVQGLALCLDQEGKLIWSKSLTERFGRISGYGGRTYTPMLDEDRVIVAFNNQSFGRHEAGAHRFLALDKRNGEIMWWSTPGGRPEDPTYSNPVIAVIGGERMLIAGNADGYLYAVKARTGEKIWGFHCSKRGLNSSPVVDDYRVIITHSEENVDDSKEMGRIFCIDGRKRGSFELPPPVTPKPGEKPKPPDLSKLGDISKTGEIWSVDGIDAGYASPLLHDGRLYVLSNSGVLYCFESATGKKIWQYVAGRGGKGSPVWADGKIYVTAENGKFLILQDEGASCKRIDEYVFNTGKTGDAQIFASPAVADGHIVFPTTTELVCIGSKQVSPQIVEMPKEPDEGPADKTPATVLVEPAEVLLKPGEKVQFHAIAYDKLGRKIGPVQAKWSFPAAPTAGSSSVGSLSPEGDFTAGSKGSIGEVTAQDGEVRGTGRIRITPNLPISEDFESYKVGDTVGWWVGATKMRFNVVEKDGSKVLKKLADDRGPILNRALAFITSPIEAGYTIESDVLGEEVRPSKRVVLRGDVGVVNARYVFELCDGGDSARIVSWTPGPRFEKKIDYNWEHDKWYRVKFTVTISGGEAHVMAKVWPRGEAEPAQWTIEATDPQPNYVGAAGIYANSIAPLYFDNVKVYR